MAISIAVNSLPARIAATSRDIRIAVTSNPTAVLTGGAVVLEATQAETDAGEIGYKYVSPRRLAEAGFFREKLTANRTYYVRTDGSDSNDGLTNTASGAFLTLQSAYSTIANSIDFGGKDVTIQLAAGTYTGGLNIAGAWTGGGTLTILGDATTPSNVVIGPSGVAFRFACGIPGTLTIQGVKVSGGSTTYGFLHVGGGALTLLKNIDFGSVTTCHISIQATGATINMNSDYAISGGAAIHWQIFNGGNIYCAARTITITNTPAFSSQFCQVGAGATAYVPGNTFSGSATGTRYYVDNNGVIQTNSGGANYLPGNGAGSDATGGVYQ